MQESSKNRKNILYCEYIQCCGIHNLDQASKDDIKKVGGKGSNIGEFGIHSAKLLKKG